MLCFRVLDVDKIQSPVCFSKLTLPLFQVLKAQMDKANVPNGVAPTPTCRRDLFGFRAEQGQGDGRDNSFFIIASVLDYFFVFDVIFQALSFFFFRIRSQFCNFQK